MMLKLVLSTLLLLQLWQGSAAADDCVEQRYTNIDNSLDAILARLQELDDGRDALRKEINAYRLTAGKANRDLIKLVRSELKKDVIPLTHEVSHFEKRLRKCCDADAVVLPEVPDSGAASSGDDSGEDAPDTQDQEVLEYFDVLSTGKKEWRLAFRGTPYINVLIYDAYVNGVGVPDEVEPGCKQFRNDIPCHNHYRNDDVLNNWTNIQEVLFAIYDDGLPVQWVRFDGTGTDYVNWFSDSRIIASSWTDLATLPHNHFSIAGEPLTGFVRRFYMSNAYGGCPHDTAWFYAGESVNSGCDYERKESMPEFHYAPGNTVAVMADPSTKKADAIGVFVKYESFVEISRSLEMS